MDLSAKRQEGLLATINVMEMEMESPRSQLTSKPCDESGDAEHTPSNSPKHSSSNASVDGLSFASVAASILADNCQSESPVSLAIAESQGQKSATKVLEKEASEWPPLKTEETEELSPKPSKSSGDVGGQQGQAIGETATATPNDWWTQTNRRRKRKAGKPAKSVYRLANSAVHKESLRVFSTSAV